MIQVGVFANTMLGGEPMALLTYSGRGKTVKVETQNDELKQLLTDLIDSPLGLPANSIAWPEDRKVWMESLSIANHAIPYWFKIIEEKITLEEVIDDNSEQGTEEAIEEYTDKESVGDTEDYSESGDSSDSEGEESA